LDQLLQWISTYGYFAIFGLLVLGIVGLPVPDETMLVLCGYLISRSRLHLVYTFLAAFTGSVSGISVSYWIGRSAGGRVIHRYGRYLQLTQERMDRVHEWFRHAGHWSLTIGYFVPGVRHATAIVAGTSELEYRQFALYAYSGAALWVTTFLSLGYYLGDKWMPVFRAIHRNLTIVAVSGAAVFCVWLVVRRWRRKRQPPARPEG
jgi:membrane protein DedA with SNARE-associated domain